MTTSCSMVSDDTIEVFLLLRKFSQMQQKDKVEYAEKDNHAQGTDK